MTNPTPTVSLAAFLESLEHGKMTVTVSELRRHSGSAFEWVTKLGNTVLITKHRKPDCVLMSVETYAYLSGDYTGTMNALQKAAQKHAEAMNDKSEDFE